LVFQTPAINEVLSKVLSKADFWKEKRNMMLNSRQHAMLNVLLDDFFGS